MISVVVEKKCPQCGMITNIAEKISQVQLDWINSHPNHDVNCQKCYHRGILSRAINLSEVRKLFGEGNRLDDIAHRMNVSVPTARRGLSLDQKKEWKLLRRSEIDEAKRIREENKKAKKANK